MVAFHSPDCSTQDIMSCYYGKGWHAGEEHVGLVVLHNIAYPALSAALDLQIKKSVTTKNRPQLSGLRLLQPIKQVGSSSLQKRVHIVAET